MSADNWALCPKCKKESTKQKLTKEANSLYGAVPKEIFLEKIKEAEKAQDEPTESLREDYEMGMDENGKFSVYYKCRCEDCGFSWNYEVHEQVT